MTLWTPEGEGIYSAPLVADEVRNLYELLSNVVVETPDGEEIRIEAAVGTACYPFDAPDIKGLLRCTDSTLLNNKNENGRHSDGIFEYKAY